VTQVAKYYDADKEAKLQKMFKSLAAAYVSRDPGAFAAASGQLRSFLVSLSPTVYPDFPSLQREVHYNSFHPFRKAMLFYLIAFVIVLTTWRVRSPGLYWIGFAAFVAGVVVAWLCFLPAGHDFWARARDQHVRVGCVGEFRRSILRDDSRSHLSAAVTTSSAAVPLSILLLLLADQFPAVLDPSLGPLVPVLRNNWLIWVHVPTITLAMRHLWWQWAWDTSRWPIMYSRHWRGRRLRSWKPGVPRDADRRAVAGGWNDPGWRMGPLRVGTILGLGSKENLGADCIGELFDSVAWSTGRVVE